MNNYDRRLLEDTSCIRISDFDQVIRKVDLVGGESDCSYQMRDEVLDLSIKRHDDGVHIEVDDATIALDNQPSNLVPGAVGRWYFICPKCERRYSALYRSEPNGPFACRICHGLEYRSRVDRRADFNARVAELTGIDPIWLQAFRDAVRRTQ